MVVGAGRLDGACWIELLMIRPIVEVERNARREGRRGDPIAKRRPFGRPRTVMHLEIGAGMMKALGHAKDGRDTDSAGEQERLPRAGLQCKVVPRGADMKAG